MREVFFSPIKIILYEHRYAMVIGLLVVIVYSIQHALIVYQLGSLEAYKPVTYESNIDVAHTYGPRARDMYENSFQSGDFGSYEYRDAPLPWPMLTPVFTALAGRISGSFENGIILTDAVFPLLTFLALYWLIFELTRRKQASLVLATLFFFTPTIAIAIPPLSASRLEILISSVFPFFGSVPDYLYFADWDYPKFTYVFYIVAFITLYRAMVVPSLLRSVTAGVIGGILFYTYFFDWAYFFVGAGILGLWCLLVKDFKRVGALITVACTTALVSIPYWLNALAVKSLPQEHDLFLRYGIELSHGFRWSSGLGYVRVLLLSALLYWIFKRRRDVLVPFLSAFLVAYIVVLNIQVLTGFNVQPDHWLRVTFPIVAISSFLLIYELHCLYGSKVYTWITRHIPLFFRAEDWKRFGAHAALLFVLFIVLSHLVLRVDYAFEHSQRYTLDTSVAQAYEWVQKHTDPLSVVVSNSVQTNSELTLYTHAKTYMLNGPSTVAPEEEVWERFLHTQALLHLSEKEVQRLLTDQDTLIYLFSTRYAPMGLDEDGPRVVPENVQAKLLAKYTNIQQADVSVPYVHDYLFLGPNERALGANLDAQSESLTQVYTNGNITIYRFTE